MKTLTPTPCTWHTSCTLCDLTAQTTHTHNPHSTPAPGHPCPVYPYADIHPYSYASVTTENLPPRLKITQDAHGYQAHFKPLTPGMGNTQQPTHYSDCYPTADLALKAHLVQYVEDLIHYEAFQALLSLSQRFDGQAVIDAFALLKQINPDEDYYLDAAADRVPPISEL